MPMNKELPPVW